MVRLNASGLPRASSSRGGGVRSLLLAASCALPVTLGIAAPAVPAAGQSTNDAPRERYEAWVQSRVDSWQSREVRMVLGQEWRDAAAGRGLLDTLRRTDLPLDRWEAHPRFPGRICARTQASGACATVSYMAGERSGDLVDIDPSDIEAAIWIGPATPEESAVQRMAWDAQLEAERVILFARGFLTRER